MDRLVSAYQPEAVVLVLVRIVIVVEEVEIGVVVVGVVVVVVASEVFHWWLPLSLLLLQLLA